MSKSSHVKAAAHGGPDASGGGGPPGTWTLIHQDQTAIAAGQTLTLRQVASAPTLIYVAFVSLTGAGSNHLCPGTTAAAPNTSTIVWDLVANGGSIDLKARAGAGISADQLTWALYSFAPA